MPRFAKICELVRMTKHGTSQRQALKQTKHTYMHVYMYIHMYDVLISLPLSLKKENGLKYLRR